MKTVSDPIRINGIECVWITEENGNTASQTMMTYEKYLDIKDGLETKAKYDYAIKNDLLNELFIKHKPAWDRLARS